MQKIFNLVFIAFFATNLIAQVPVYYNSIDFTETGLPLKTQLANLIISTHTTPITYDDVWDVLIASDVEPGNTSEVLLIYGYNDADGSIFNDRTRDKNNYGGSSGQWNREHTFAKSLGNPDLGTTGPGSDAHNLRASDVDMNNDRGSKLFADGSGNAGTTGANWYPGDEWKGDVARIIMYMYLRYGLQCRPYYCAVGAANSIDANMVNVLLEWNVEDPVSQLELNRNDEIQDWQGNRNPFIDNPYIATKIWGGTPAEDTWGGLGIVETNYSYSLYPNPVINHQLYFSCTSGCQINDITIFDINGKVIQQINVDSYISTPILLEEIPSGTYFVQVQTSEELFNYKIVSLE